MLLKPGVCTHEIVDYTHVNSEGRFGQCAEMRTSSRPEELANEREPRSNTRSRGTLSNQHMSLAGAANQRELRASSNDHRSSPVTEQELRP